MNMHVLLGQYVLGSRRSAALAAVLDRCLACAVLGQLSQQGWHAAVGSCNLLCAALADSSCVCMMLKVGMQFFCMLVYAAWPVFPILIKPHTSPNPAC